jgi:hypothetical protein
MPLLAALFVALAAIGGPVDGPYNRAERLDNAV